MAKQNNNSKIFLVLLAVIIVAGAGWLVFAGQDTPDLATGTPPASSEVFESVEADPNAGVAIGPESAPITIEEFYDFSCPHCANFAGFAGKLLRQNYVDVPDASVRWVAYDYILGSFPNSYAAHVAARCADEQGRYWPVHDLLLSRQTEWYASPQPMGSITEIAEAGGVEMGAFRTCLGEDRHEERLIASYKYGASKGVTATPSLFINGEPISLAGVEPYGHIENLIQTHLQAMDGSAEEDSDTP